MTFQRPAYEQVMIAQDTFILTLRPTLRAAAILEQRYGFPALFRAVDEANFSIITDIILTAGTDRDRASTFLFASNREPLLSLFAKVSQPLNELVSMFTPAPVQSLDMPSRTGKATPDDVRKAVVLEINAGAVPSKREVEDRIAEARRKAAEEDRTRKHLEREQADAERQQREDEEAWRVRAKELADAGKTEAEIEKDRRKWISPSAKNERAKEARRKAKQKREEERQKEQEAWDGDGVRRDTVRAGSR